MEKIKLGGLYRGFKGGMWQREINVRDFIQKNNDLYEGDEDFLSKPTEKTKKVWHHVEDLLMKEFKKGGVLDIDTKTPSTIVSHAAGFIDKRNESIVGIQTDKPLKRGIKPKGGVRLVDAACKAYGYELSPKVKEIFTKYQRTHNDGVFDIYYSWDEFFTPGKQLFRKKGVITGLPDNYGRGRIIGDYRRVALYGVDLLIAEKKHDQTNLFKAMDEQAIKMREEVQAQIHALLDLKTMAASYGCDIGGPAACVKQAIQWTYFAYLAAVKEQDGAAMSLGRIDAFFDIFAQRDLKNEVYLESEIQEFIDQFVIKLRIVRHLRVPEYNELFAGDPTWVTCVLGGLACNGNPLVSKTTYRLLHTLTNLGPAPEPNMTILWHKNLPANFKDYACKVAIDSSSIQLENDELMRPIHGDDYAIACCVSAMTIGKEMQFFGARCNFAKLLLLSINEGKDELDGSLIVRGVPPLKNKDILDYEEVKEHFYSLMKWLAKKYVQTLNIIHYMHDKYYYENSQMALHDTMIKRYMAFGIAGFSIVADSLSAIKYAKVKPIWDKKLGVATGFKIVGDFPKFGNDDDRVDEIGIDAVKNFISRLREFKTYRDAEHTLSLLTITANVVYGHKTGATPDGRESGAPFAPGANPMHNRDQNGALASLNSLAKIPYDYCRDGISNTFSISPHTLGKSAEMRIDNLRGMLDVYFQKGGHHININVLNRETLKDAMKHPAKYPQLTIRVSGYAVHFIKLTREQQEEVISRTFHKNF